MTTISEREYDELMMLYKEATTMPVIKMSTDPLEKDWSAKAWDRVRDKMDELGRKYGYNPATHAINSNREVVEHQYD